MGRDNAWEEKWEERKQEINSREEEKEKAVVPFSVFLNACLAVRACVYVRCECVCAHSGKVYYWKKTISRYQKKKKRFFKKKNRNKNKMK